MTDPRGRTNAMADEARSAAEKFPAPAPRASTAPSAELHQLSTKARDRVAEAGEPTTAPEEKPTVR